MIMCVFACTLMIFLNIRNLRLNINFREQLQQSLSITLDILLGAGAALPHWEEEPISL